MNKFVVLFTATMFLAIFSLIGCNKSQEPPKPEETSVQEPTAQEPASAKPKPLPTVGNAAFTVIDFWAKKPIKDAVVNVTVKDNMQMVKTNVAGKATFNKLPFGSYTFTVASPKDISETDVVTVNMTVPRGATATKTVSLRIRQ
jgi:hypothetical protein